ncbi:hypothetical protein F751_5301 [Auxenochlorella protothecoides]|uniref:Uncharacterized protein n=1 Tax=Auxenochlorella protothecoides TaxID=3075 RepID=A0A087SRN4_AUXPR|nr:hypothetical protein F751_5301 [Auxenochlorella protothecoides]KFM28388.1 hypothetical protein F751_5301 [Auxenochlorella protothecoides]
MDAPPGFPVFEVHGQGGSLRDMLMEALVQSGIMTLEGGAGVFPGSESMDDIMTRIMDDYQPVSHPTARRAREAFPRLRAGTLAARVTQALGELVRQREAQALHRPARGVVDGAGPSAAVPAQPGGRSDAGSGGPSSTPAEQPLSAMAMVAGALVAALAGTALGALLGSSRRSQR